MIMKKITLKQVAAASGVSVNTASLAMRDSHRLPGETRKRIQDTAKRLNYVPNRMAQALKGSQTRTIGLIMHSLSDTGHLQFFSAIEKRLRKTGYSILTETVKGRDFDMILAKLLSSGIDALIVNPGNEEILDKLKESGLSNICIAGKKLFPDTEYDQIYYSEYEGSLVLMQHLIDLGHRRIGFINAEQAATSPRLVAYKTALKIAGIPFSDELFIYIPYDELNIENIDLARSKLMGFKERPSAIFAFHDEVAIKLMHCLYNAGFRVPDDVAIAGINNTWAGEFSLIPLTSVDLKLSYHGELCAETVLRRIENPDSPVTIKKIEPELCIRESTAQ